MWPFSSYSDSASSPQDAQIPLSASPDAEFSSPLPDARAPSSSTPSVSRYDAILTDEQKYQALQYPTPEEVPGCMRLLDDFLSCHGGPPRYIPTALQYSDHMHYLALIPELKNFYRHGEPKDCSWRWQDFKYCLSLKSEDEEGRRQLWIKRRAEWWVKRRVGRSSEDVWDMRQVPLENFPPLYVEELPNETNL